MSLNFDSPIPKLVLNASLEVQLVMMLLLLMSLFSWYLIFRTSRKLKRARQAAQQFEQDFWQTQNLNNFYSGLNEKGAMSGLEAIFQAGYSEFARLRKVGGALPGDLVNSAQRAMRVALSRHADDLEQGLSTLATIGSISPYIGLFGTVWGIMHSFHALGDVKQATLAMVAPGISEALIATALGLFAAIPAVMAYNNAIADIDRLLNRYDAFTDEFASLLQRQAYQLNAAQKSA